MEKHGENVQHQEGTLWPMLQSPLVTDSVVRAHLPSLHRGMRRSAKGRLRCGRSWILCSPKGMNWTCNSP